MIEFQNLLAKESAKGERRHKLSWGAAFSEAGLLLLPWVALGIPLWNPDEPRRWLIITAITLSLFGSCSWAIISADRLGVEATPLLAAMLERRTRGSSVFTPVMVGAATAVGQVIVWTILLRIYSGSFNFGLNEPNVPLSDWSPIQITVVVAYLEEVLFRLLLMTSTAWVCRGFFGLAHLQNPVNLAVVVSLLLTSTLFGLVHLNQGDPSLLPWNLHLFQILGVSATWVGFIQGLLFWKLGLEASMINHCLYNLLIVYIPFRLLAS